MLKFQKSKRNCIKIVIQYIACAFILLGIYSRVIQEILPVKDEQDLGNFIYLSSQILVFCGSIVWILYLKIRKEKMAITAHLILAFAFLLQIIAIVFICVTWEVAPPVYGFMLFGIPSTLAFLTEGAICIPKSIKNLEGARDLLIVINAIASSIVGLYCFGWMLDAMMSTYMEATLSALYNLGVGITFVIVAFEEAFKEKKKLDNLSVEKVSGKTNIILVMLLIAMVVGCGFLVPEGKSKLTLAIEQDNLQGVKEALQEAEYDLEKLPEGCFGSDYRAMGLALQQEGRYTEIAMIQTLIEAGADVNHKVDSETYLMSVAGDYERCKIFLEAGADVNQVDESGESALSYCLNTGYYSEYAGEKSEVMKCIKLLIDYGAEIDKEDVETCIDGAKYSLGVEFLQKLLEENKPTGLSQGMEYAMLGDNEKFLSYLKKHDIMEREEKQLMLQAAAHCNIEVLKKLSEKGYKFSVEDQFGQTMLHVAARYNDENVVTYLLLEGMDLNKVTSSFGINPLTEAVIGGKEKNVKVLLDAGARWQQPKGWDKTSVWETACEAGTEKSIKILLDNGFVPLKNEIVRGYRVCNEETFHALLENEIPYDNNYTEDGLDRTTFTDLCKNSSKFALELLEISPTLPITPEILEYVCEGADIELAKAVIDKAEDLNVSYDRSPLESAVDFGQMELVECLVEHGADVNYQIPEYDEDDIEYHTVMHKAADEQSRDILQYLLDHGGDIKRKNSEGKTPYDIAKDANMKENMKLLK